MIILISGASHTGKTNLAQKILEEYKFPYLSIDHLKMGLIRSKMTDLTVLDDDKLTDFLWPINVEIIKTAIENKQNLVIEGCYVPFNWNTYFNNDYLKEIKYYCLVFKKEYIISNYDKILQYQNVIEKRKDLDIDINELINDNLFYLNNCINNNLNYILIDEEYNVYDLIKKDF